MADTETRGSEIDLDRLVHEGRVKLEITGGIPTWEASPSIRHQKVVYRIQTSIKPLPDRNTGCECFHLAGIDMRFPDGSLKRPDIAIFCKEPPDVDEALNMVPEAVIEIISPGYEYKDLEMNPPFYLGQGVRDVVIVDPRSGAVTHYRAGEVMDHKAPVTLSLLCGCGCTVP